MEEDPGWAHSDGSPRKKKLSHNKQYSIDFNKPGVHENLVKWVQDLAVQNKASSS